MSSSLSLPSEPPDVGNWFSTYEYKSPDPDSNVNFEDPACTDEERQGEGEANFTKTRTGDEAVAGEDDKHNEDLSLAEGLDSFSSRPGLLSEPPDIRNWFSSYAYESCVLGDSVSIEREREDKGVIFEEENEHEVRREYVQPRESVTHNSCCDTNTSRDDGSVEMKKNISFSNTSHLEKILQSCVQDRTLQLNANPAKCEETTSLNHGSPACYGEASLMLLDKDKNSTRPPDSVIKEAGSKAMIQHENRGTSASSHDRFSARNFTCLRDQENGEDMMSSDGFVTTRKTRHTAAKDENSSREMLLESPTNTGTVSLTCKKPAVLKRQALAEVTNVQESSAMEVTGKWQCPQKGKPNLGPALKQLRLERWVRRN